MIDTLIAYEKHINNSKIIESLELKNKKYILATIHRPSNADNFDNLCQLLEILQAFANTGNTVVVIEHNLDVVKNSDWIIDLGPEGGNKGGRVVAEGTPESITKVKDSLTGLHLKDVLN